jgi:iron-sulfur cluster insertion protein
MITITDNATLEIASVLTDSNEPFMRIAVQGGGCSGFSYIFDFAKEKNEDDFEFGKVLVDSMSLQYLQGATVDFSEDIMGSSFNIINPHAQTTCGCGSSFSV